MAKPALDCTVTYADLNNGAAVSRVIGRGRYALPICENVAIRTEGQKIRCWAYPAGPAAAWDFNARVAVSGGITVPARTLKRVLKALKTKAREPLRLQAPDPSHLTITAGNTQVSLQGLPIEEYPPLPHIKDPSTYQVTVGILREASTRLLPLAKAAVEEKWQGIHVIPTDTDAVGFWATDRFRVTHIPLTPTAQTGMQHILIPTEALEHFLALSRRLDGEEPAYIHAGQSAERDDPAPRVTLTCGPLTVTAGSFTPKDPGFAAWTGKQVLKPPYAVDREELADAISTLAGIAQDVEGKRVELHFNPPNLRLGTGNGETGRAEVTIPLKNIPNAETNPETCRHDIHHGFLHDAVASVGGNIVAIYPPGDKWGPLLIQSVEDSLPMQVWIQPLNPE